MHIMARCLDVKLTSFRVCLRVMIKVLNPARVKRTGPAEDSMNLPKTTKSSSLLSMYDFKRNLCTLLFKDLGRN